MGGLSIGGGVIGGVGGGSATATTGGLSVEDAEERLAELCAAQWTGLSGAMSAAKWQDKVAGITALGAVVAVAAAGRSIESVDALVAYLGAKVT